MYSLAYQLAADQLRDLPANFRIVVLHPNYAQQHICFSSLMSEDGCVYIRFDGRNLTRSQLHEQFQAVLLTQINQLRAGSTNQIILDECDRALPKDLEAFIVDIFNQLDPGRLILATRFPPHALLENAHLREQTVFMPVEESLMLWDYAQRNTAEKKVLLEVRALGTGRVLRDGKSVENWDGLLPRSLFFYLVDKGMTTRNDIFETFWPTLSVREATNVFHVTKRKISEVLGVDLTVYWSGFYHISPEIELSYDVVRFSELLQDSAIAPVETAVDLLRRANSLYRDDFLTSLDMPWVLDRRRELRQAYGEALIALGKAREQQGGIEEALGLYLRATTTNPHREDVALSTMKLYHSLGLPADALKVYDRLKNELQQRLGVDPANHLQELAGELERVIQNNQ
jgi:DNA-binding SARP family transcriptional activator